MCFFCYINRQGALASMQGAAAPSAPLLPTVALSL